MTPNLNPKEDTNKIKLQPDSLIVVPLIRLPSETIDGGNVEAEKELIRTKILGCDNKTLFEDKESWALLCKLGGDLMINAFACNFKIDGKVNQDVVSLKSHQTIENNMLINRFSRGRRTT